MLLEIKNDLISYFTEMWIFFSFMNLFKIVGNKENIFKIKNYFLRLYFLKELYKFDKIFHLLKVNFIVKVISLSNLNLFLTYSHISHF
jgi:hypothetical protein